MRGFKKMAVSLAASAAMVGGLALATPATASAEPVGEYKKPGLAVEQGDFGGGKNIEVTITNPNPASFVLDGTACTPYLMDGQLALEAIVAFDNKNFGELLKVVTSNGSRIGSPAINSVGTGATKSTAWQVEDGVYILVGVCGGAANVLNPAGVGVAVQPVIVPSGIGSLASGSAFGSLILESGGAIASVLPLLLSLGSAGGALS